MGVTGQISVARIGQSVRILEQPSDIVDLFDPAISPPSLESGDHVVLYPGDFQPTLSSDGPITIPTDVTVTILPGALVGYDNVDDITNRYSYIEGEIENIADLEISNLYATEVERQAPRVRIYPRDVTALSGQEVPFFGFDTLDEAVEQVDPGDTVVVFPGEYFPKKNLYVDGVTWNFLDGTTVTYNKNFDGGSIYPHALFDDNKDVSGENFSGGAKNMEILGNAEIRVEPPEPQPTGIAPPSGAEDLDWDSWNLYSFLAVNAAGSRVSVEGKRLVMSGDADGLVKASGGSRLDFDFDEIVVEDGLESTGSIPIDSPGAFVFNGGGALNISGGEVKADINSIIYDGFGASFAYGANTSDRVETFKGRLDFEVEDVVIRNSFTEVPYLLDFETEASPSLLVLRNTESRGSVKGIVLSGDGTGSTKLFVKDSVVDVSNTGQSSPIRLVGDFNEIDPVLHDSWLICGNGNSSPSISGSVGSNWPNQIKVFGNSFADNAPAEPQYSLDDEFNNIIWGDDVENPIK